MLALSLAVLLAAHPAPKPPSPPPPPPGAPAAARQVLEQADEVKEIEIDERRAKAIYRVHTAISMPVVVEFPEPFVAPPACGDCADASKPGPSMALFALQADPGANFLIVKPRLYPGLQSDGSMVPADQFVTNLTVRLQSLTLTVQVELVEDKRLADARVRFVLPNRPTESRYVVEALAKGKAELEAAYASRVEAGAEQHFLRAFSEPHECRARSNRVRSEDVVVELQELCRFGKRVIVRFTVENRGRALFVVDTVATGVGSGTSYTATEARTYLSLPEVQFQQVAAGVALFDVEDPTAKAFELRITEKAGRARVLALQDFGF